MKKIGIITHRGCDLDALCSVDTVAKIIKENYPNTKVIIIREESYLEEKLRNMEEYITLEQSKDIDLDYLLVCDVNENDRVHGIEVLNKVPWGKRYLIDHHEGNREELQIPKENKIIYPKASSTCEIIALKMMDKKMVLTKDLAHNLYLGILSDTANLTRDVTSDTINIIDKLPLTEKEKLEIEEKLEELSEKQKYLLDKIEKEDINLEGLNVYKLLEPYESGDITSLVKHSKFQDKIGPTEEKPISCFIIGIGNNYFIKFNKRKDCDVDILSIAIKCNGGGHENRCAGRFYNSNYNDVLDIIVSEYKKTRGKTVIKK